MRLVMLNYNAIQKAVDAEQNASDFPKLMQAFKKMGVLKYDYLVESGKYRYYDNDGYLDFKMNGVPQKVAPKSNATQIKAAVQKAQTGQITFEVFCELAAAAGNIYWRSDLTQKVVSYYDRTDDCLLAEPIPGL